MAKKKRRTIMDMTTAEADAIERELAGESAEADAPAGPVKDGTEDDPEADAAQAARDEVRAREMDGDDPEPVNVDGDGELPAIPDDIPALEVAPGDMDTPADTMSALSLLSTLEADTDVADASAPRGKGRYDTPEKRAKRNAKEKAKRDATNARAGKVARATGVAFDAATRAAKGDDPKPVPVVAGDELAMLLGLSFHAVALTLPERYGGGTLSTAERDMLGKAWAIPLAPYLGGAAGPWAVAAISTVQVFAIRAMTYVQPVAPVVTHSRPETAAPVVPSQEPPQEPAKPAPGKVTQQERGVGGEL